MQLKADQQRKPERTSTGRQQSKISAAGTDRHAVKIRMGVDGFTLEIRSGNSVFIFAIVITLMVSLAGIIVLLKIL